ncbi:MAG: VCBS repeat-containing protein [Planctomycetota bacterium]
MKLLLAVVPVACFLSVPSSSQARFAFHRSPLPSIQVGYDLCTGDVDGDGDIDLVVSNDHSVNQLLLNDGTGAFVDATAGRLVTPSSGGFPSNASYEGDLADLDGDNDLDLVFCNDHNLANRVYLNDGLGFFTDVTATALPPHLEWSIDQVLGDFDGDGDVDWYVSNEAAGPGQISRLYLNDGHAVFQDVSATNLPAGSRSDYRGFAVDLELDGDLDIVLPRNAGAQVLVNQGGAVFTLDTALVPFLGLVHPADVDGNGLVDLLAFSGARLLRNLSGLAFDSPVVLPATTVTSLDVEGDGDIDLLGASVLLLNDGLGAFTSVPGLPAGFPSLSPDSVCVADLDGDGDDDLVDARSDSRPSAWFNLSTQLLAPLAPVAGQPYELQLHGGSVAEPVQFIVAVSLAGRVQQLPFGTLRLDLRAGRLLPPVLASGSPLTLGTRVPARLAGQDVYIQALGVHPTRGLFLTNALHEIVP